MSTSNIAGNRLASKSLIANVTKSYSYAGVIDTIGARGPGAYIDGHTFAYNLTCGGVTGADCGCCGDSGPPYYNCNTCAFDQVTFPAAEIKPSSSFLSGNPNRGYYDSSTNKGFKSFATTGTYGGNYYGINSPDAVCNCAGKDENYYITLGGTTLGEGSWAGIKEADSSLWTWGSNSNYTLGGGAFDVIQNSPTQLGSFSWKMVSGGRNYFFAAIRYDGLLFTWGDNSYGQLGDNSTTTRSSPVQIGSDTWKYVACGDVNTAAIRSDNTLWIWGYNTDGECGDGTTTWRSSPVQISGGGLWKFVSNSGAACFGLKTDGTMWSWGWNVYGQLGDNTTVSKSSPVQIGTAYSDWTHITLYHNNGLGKVYAIRSNGTLWAWGYYPRGLTSNQYSSPVQVGSATNHASGAYGPCYSGQRVNGLEYNLFLTTSNNVIGYYQNNSTQTNIYTSGSAVGITQNYNLYGVDDTNTNTYLIKYIV